MPSEEQEKTASDWLKEAQKDYMRIAVLILLSKKRHHGYEIMKEVKERTEGFWKPTAGSIYPILRSLEKAGYIKGEWFFQKKRKRKIYQITEEGRLILERALIKQSQIANSMNTLFEEFTRNVLDMEIESLPMPRIPTPFSVFLEDRNKNPEDTPETLKMKRTRIEHIIEMLQNRLKIINKRLAKLEKAEEKNS